MTGLKRLEAEVARELERLAYPARPWVLGEDAASGYDVVVVGAGQAGLTIAFGLRRERVERVLVIDERSAGREGPWVTFARMHTLRTPKHLTGPDLGVPGLTFQAWYEARFGEEAWRELGFIPKELWMEYLVWYRRVLDLPVENGVRLERILPGRHGFRLEVNGRGGRRELAARKVVLATGMEGSGAWTAPDFITANLPRERWAHTSEAIDFAALAGRRVGILGAGASAFDNAATALEAGAAEVHLFFRRRELPKVNPYRWMESAGFLRHFPDLDDAWRWRFMNRILTMNQPPPQGTYERAVRFANFHLRPASPWFDARVRAGACEVRTPQGWIPFDFLILGTGFSVDLALRPELASFADEVALWADRYTPPPGEENPALARYPYLGPYFEFTEKHPGHAHFLSGLFEFTFGATLSLGLSGASISGMKFAVPRLVYGVTRQLFLDEVESHYRSLLSYSEPELREEVALGAEHARPGPGARAAGGRAGG